MFTSPFVRLLSLIFIVGLFSNFQTPVEPLFEGIINYQHIVKSKNPVGTTYRSSRFFVKGGMYRSETTTNDIRAIEIYGGRDSLFSFALPNYKCVWWSDVRAQKEPILETKLEPNGGTIMNINCQVLTVRTASLTVRYYFSPEKFKVNPALFQLHNFKHWSICMQKTGGSLPLKIVYDYPQHTIEMQAISLENKKLDKGFFIPPYDKTMLKTQ